MNRICLFLQKLTILMKRTLFFLSFFYITILSYGQNLALECGLGFDYEISYHDYWGMYRPVVKSVHIGSPAEKAGLKMNDIIEQIGGIETRNYYSERIFAMLHEEKFIRLTVSNLGYRNKEIVFSKHCDLLDAVSEKQMTSKFSSHSLNNIQEKLLNRPFKTTVKQCPEVNYLYHKTFCFLDKNDSISFQGKTDNYINELIKKELENRGLVYAAKSPDLYVSAVYSYYTLNIRFISPAYSTRKEPYIIWQSVANEQLTKEYTIDKYAEINIPLMLMQYPYPQSFEEARFRYLKKKFNYTGIYYDMNDFQKIIYVDPVSPAAQAGIQTGDEIRKINGIKVTGNPQKLSPAFSYLFYFEPENIISFDLKRGKKQLSVEVKPIVMEFNSFENY